ncbi:Puromycin-sensitive aminopeptidase [Thelohanellus kitauei]|uniref:Aminopeptidase n=1 Tax=Thelohanellus kitauei TaxID=669202 RepID=A0A0C2JGD8_THEKT|nr:Puromycin-sensitive aminopeptidase [Thelohanellus kitauei]
MESESECSLRLPETIFPIHYDLDISLDPSNRFYSGHVSIALNVRSSTDTVILNATKMKINEVKLTTVDKVLSPKKTELIEMTRQMIISFETQIPTGLSTLEISFDNRIDDDVTGIHFVSYYDDKQKLHECVETFFETLEKTETLSDRLTKYCFKMTLKMSTYTLVFVAGDFTRISKTGSSGITYSVYAPMYRAGHLKHSLYACEAFVDFYSDFFKSSISFGEAGSHCSANICLGDDLLFYDPEITTRSCLRWNTCIIAHEIAHQWCGNLVTMKWWADIWLNESFATWLMYLAVEKVFPSLKIWKHFYLQNYALGLELDSYVANHAVEIDAKYPTILFDVFDTITYSKGSSLIRYMYNLIGHQNIQKGLGEYYLKFQYGNVSTKDLWECLEKASNKPVSKLIGSFTQQTGHPVLHVDHEISPDGSFRMTFRVRQERYLLNADKKAAPQTWIIPIDVDCVHESNVIKSHTLLEKEFDELVVEGEKGLKYVLFNPKRTGFFRVHYSESLFAMLFKHLKELDFEDRLGLLIDYYSFARSGLIGTDKYLDLIMRFWEIKEEDEDIWMTIIMSLSEIEGLIFFSSDYQRVSHKLAELYLKVMSPILSRYDFTADEFDYDESKLILISTLMKVLLNYDQKLRDKLLSWFDEYIQKKLKVVPDFRECIFRACYTSRPHFEKLLKYYESTPMTEEKIEILLAASSATDPSIIKQVYEFSISKSMKHQYGIHIYETFASNPLSYEIGWEFFKSHVKEVLDVYVVPFFRSQMISHLFSGFVFMEKYQECLDFIKSYPSIGFNQCIKRSFESIEIRSRWFKSDEKKIIKWVEDLDVTKVLC